MPEILIKVAQTGSSTSQAAVRGHTVVIDRPEAKGGADEGPMGGELFLAGLGGCFMSNLLAAIKSRNVDADAIIVEVSGMLEENPPRFSSVELRVSGNYPDRKEMEHLAAISEKGCIVANTVREAVVLKVTVQESVDSSVR